MPYKLLARIFGSYTFQALYLLHALVGGAFAVIYLAVTGHYLAAYAVGLAASVLAGTHDDVCSKLFRWTQDRAYK